VRILRGHGANKRESVCERGQIKGKKKIKKVQREGGSKERGKWFEAGDYGWLVNTDRQIKNAEEYLLKAGGTLTKEKVLKRGRETGRDIKLRDSIRLRGGQHPVVRKVEE